MKTQRKGFTLIELMVVIVIIGILAAVAIPKLFGMSAKAKAAEVGPAAGTWSKLQSAYLVETNGFGDDIQIAYVKPGASRSTTNTAGTGNFIYNTATGNTGSAATWTASNPVKHGDCGIGGTWTATITTGDTKPLASVAGSDGLCEALTPNFSKLQ